MSRYIPMRKRQHLLGISDSPNYVTTYFHLNNLRKIKEALGEQCTFISHGRHDKKTLKEVEVEGKDGRPIKRNVLVSDPKFYIVAKFKENKPMRAVLNGTPDDIKPEYYSQLKNDLVDAARKKGIIRDS